MMKRHLMKAAIASLLVVTTLCGAFALNVDQNRNVLKRYFGYQMTHYYRLTINYNDPNISTGQAFGALAQYSFIDAVDCYVSTAFNATGNNYVTFGISKTAANE